MPTCRSATRAQPNRRRQYIETLSATSGLPLRSWSAATWPKSITPSPTCRPFCGGLTRGLDLAVLDAGLAGRLSFYPVAASLGLVMPSNSPAVNSLWLPAIPLKIPVMIKPGREEPWTPYRLIQAFIAAGCPPEAFGFYPTDHEGAAEILRSCGRALIFGDKDTTAAYANNPAIQIHGPGYSKILVGEDQIERWPEFIDLMVSAISDNGGRSCINASAIVVPKHAAEIADALARKLGPIAPLPASDENARLAAFANAKMARFHRRRHRRRPANSGRHATSRPSSGTARARRNLTAPLICGPPSCCAIPSTIRWPTANFSAPTPASSQCPQSAMLEQIGPSLAVTAITRDPAFIGAIAGIAADRAPEHRPDLHHDRFLGPAARREHV